MPWCRGQGGKGLVRTNGESHAPYASPFQAAAAHNFSGDEAASSNACVPFTTPELRALDVQREEFQVSSAALAPRAGSIHCGVSGVITVKSEGAYASADLHPCTMPCHTLGPSGQLYDALLVASDKSKGKGAVQGLALYGQGDHREDEDAAHFGTVAMTVRGSYLLLIFLPFLLLGPMLLLLAQALQPRAGATAPGAPFCRSVECTGELAGSTSSSGAGYFLTQHSTVAAAAAAAAAAALPARYACAVDQHMRGTVMFTAPCWAPSQHLLEANLCCRPKSSQGEVSGGRHPRGGRQRAEQRP